MSWLFALGGQSIGASASAPVFPMNIQDWFPLGWIGWISLQSKGLSRVFSNTTVPCLLCVVLDPKQDINKCALPIWLISWSGDGWMWPMLPWESPGVPDSSGSALLLGHDSVLPTEADGPEPTLLGQITTRNTESPGVRTLLPTLGSPEPANWGLGWAVFILEGLTSFVTFTHCCQEPKNTFINGKTGMAPQRNILTSPEEPAGRFRAHPQEAGAPYLLGSPPGEDSMLLRPRFHAGPSGSAPWAGLCWGGSCKTAGSIPGRDAALQGSVASSWVTAPSRHSPLWPIPSDCTRGLELLLDSFPDSLVRSSAS